MDVEVVYRLKTGFHPEAWRRLRTLSVDSLIQCLFCRLWENVEESQEHRLESIFRKQLSGINVQQVRNPVKVSLVSCIEGHQAYK